MHAFSRSIRRGAPCPISEGELRAALAVPIEIPRWSLRERGECATSADRRARKGAAIEGPSASRSSEQARREAETAARTAAGLPSLTIGVGSADASRAARRNLASGLPAACSSVGSCHAWWAWGEEGEMSAWLPDWPCP